MAFILIKCLAKYVSPWCQSLRCENIMDICSWCHHLCWWFCLLHFMTFMCACHFYRCKIDPFSNVKLMESANMYKNIRNFIILWLSTVKTMCVICQGKLKWTVEKSRQFVWLLLANVLQRCNAKLRKKIAIHYFTICYFVTFPFFYTLWLFLSARWQNMSLQLKLELKLIDS